jgi:hypothetical protein
VRPAPRARYWGDEIGWCSNERHLGSLAKASVLRPIDVVSVRARSEETARHSTRPYPQPMLLLLSFSSSPLESKERFAKASRRGACRTGVLAAPAIRSSMRLHVVCPWARPQGLLCCHGRHVADPNDATSFSAWQRATRSGRERHPPCSGARRRLPIEDLRHV